MRQALEFPVKISVVMPTYNVSVPILKEAVKSILNQSFREFEFIIIDDASTDGTWDYLNSLDDKRLKLIRNETNLGITKSLNIGLRAAKGKYIARMDSDDISLPMRFEKQYKFMESHPNVILCGTRIKAFGDMSYTSGGRWRRKMENMDDYRIRLLFSNPGPYHPTVFLRHEMLKKHHIEYNEKYICTQDYDLFTVVSRYGKVYTLDDVLVHYRFHKQQMFSTHRENQIRTDKNIQKKLLSQIIENISEEEIDKHFFYMSGKCPEAAIDPWVVDWCDRILAGNEQHGVYNQRKLRKHIKRIKRRLVRQKFAEEQSMIEKIRLSSQYLPFDSLCRVIIKDTLNL